MGNRRMQYMGGKSRLAKEIASTIRPQGRWWDPFCGGLSVARELAKIYPEGMVSDICFPLISLYRAVQRGWSPPVEVTSDEYQSAKSLPDSNPLKAFCGFGCSHGGKWFGGFCPPTVVYSKTHPDGMRQNKIGATRDSLLRDIVILQRCLFAPLSFFDISPVCGKFSTIYCDPPYANTQGYNAVAEEFDSMLFWERCLEWTDVGTRVYVSELSSPLPSSMLEVVWERQGYEKRLGSGGGQINGEKNEKLFLII